MIFIKNNSKPYGIKTKTLRKKVISLKIRSVVCKAFLMPVVKQNHLKHSPVMAWFAPTDAPA